MTDTIHYIGTSSLDEYQHLHLPITEGDLPADEVVLIYAEGEDPLYDLFRERLTEAFNEAGIPVQEETFGRYEFTQENIEELYQFATSELQNNLQAEKETYVNAGSHPIQLGYCFLFAAEMFAIESRESLTGSEKGPSPMAARQRTHLYTTRGSSYLDDILNALNAFSKTLTEIEGITKRQKEVISGLRQQTEQADASFQAVAELMGVPDGGTKNWRQLVEEIAESQSERTDQEAGSGGYDDPLTKGVEQIFEGLEMVNEGISNLTENTQHKGIIASLDGCTAPQQDALRTLLKAIDDENKTQSSNSMRLLPLLQSQVSYIEESLDELEFRNQDIKRIAKEEEPIARSRYEEINEYGVSWGLQHYRLPSAPGTQLNDMQTVILATLSVVGGVDSITEAIDHLIRISLQVVLDDIDESIEADYSPKLIAIYREYLDNRATPSSSRERAIDGLRSKVQYNINKLEDKNLIQKEKQGRSNEISLTMSGQFWNAAKGYESISDLDKSDPLYPIFESITDDLNEKI